MKAGHFSEHWTSHSDRDGEPSCDLPGRPAGGVSSGRGFAISWQNGPLGRGEERQEPNGAFVEDVIDAVIRRIEFYQEGEFACGENQAALHGLRAAAENLDSRTKDREQREVEGTHEV